MESVPSTHENENPLGPNPCFHQSFHLSASWDFKCFEKQFKHSNKSSLEWWNAALFEHTSATLSALNNSCCQHSERQRRQADGSHDVIMSERAGSIWMPQCAWTLCIIMFFLTLIAEEHHRLEMKTHVFELMSWIFCIREMFIFSRWLWCSWGNPSGNIWGLARTILILISQHWQVKSKYSAIGIENMFLGDDIKNGLMSRWPSQLRRKVVYPAQMKELDISTKPIQLIQP